MEYQLKKSLGQHFLVNEQICRDIADAVLSQKPQQLLEIGPGAGAITKYFLQQPGIDFKAVELDREKVAYLTRTYTAIAGKLVEASILDIEPPFSGKFDVVGNFPYNISTEILFKMLGWREQLNTVTGMFQKEVAERVAAKEGSKIYGVTSVLLQAFFSVHYLFDVEADCFNPPPKVKSGVIQLKPLPQPVEMKSYQKYRQLVKMAFNQRRKTLRNAAKSLFLPDKLQDPIFDRRPEQVSVQEFGTLTFKMQ